MSWSPAQFFPELFTAFSGGLDLMIAHRLGLPMAFVKCLMPRPDLCKQELLVEYHPDKNSSPHAKEVFQQLGVDPPVLSQPGTITSEQQNQLDSAADLQNFDLLNNIGNTQFLCVCNSRAFCSGM